MPSLVTMRFSKQILEFRTTVVLSNIGLMKRWSYIQTFWQLFIKFTNSQCREHLCKKDIRTVKTTNKFFFKPGLFWYSRVPNEKSRVWNVTFCSKWKELLHWETQTTAMFRWINFLPLFFDVETRIRINFWQRLIISRNLREKIMVIKMSHQE